ncbi:hypothetical protein RF55_11684 [Lasius niger]|uniref:exodeoxyribonuclease III n=1 Tax=Lasius niger TaxID=67767 RepID=A0A0J7N807_LASNI|nr:hypothetical protein RF55_11684 [Lasius niger]
MRGRTERGERGGKEEEIWKVTFWNIAGLKNKDKGFWDRIGEWDVIVLIETWVGEKGWRKLKSRLPKGFKWGVQYASKKNKKGRAMGGMIMGIRRKGEIEVGEIEITEEGMMTGTLKRRGEEWRIVGVYVNEDIERKIEGLKKWMEESEEKGKRVVIGGDFNTRIGEMGGRVNMGENEEIIKSRNFKDKKINRERRRLVEVLEETGWSIINDNIRGDEEGEYTYTGGRGNTVIDYVLGNEGVWEKIERLEIGEDIDSDHHPVICWIKGEGIWKKKRKARQKG